jgi:hypothetical protein
MSTKEAFTAGERAAMHARARELKDRTDAVRAVAERLINATAPDLNALG